jgi:hypothetical protein
MSRKEMQLVLRQMMLMGIIQNPAKQPVSPRILSQKPSPPPPPKLCHMLGLNLLHNWSTLWTAIEKLNKDTKVCKISLIIPSITSKFQNNYLAEENVSTESLKVWQKTYEVCQSRTGYLCIKELEGTACVDGNLKSSKTVFKCGNILCTWIPFIILNTWHLL